MGCLGNTAAGLVVDRSVFVLRTEADEISRQLRKLSSVYEENAECVKVLVVFIGFSFDRCLLI